MDLRCNREKSTDSNDDDAQSKGTPELRSKAILIQDKGLVVTREKIRRYLMKLYKRRKKRWRSERIEVKRERERERDGFCFTAAFRDFSVMQGGGGVY